MVAMFGHAPGVDEDVIYVNQHELMEKLPEHLMHKVLEYGGGVDKAIGHDEKFIVTSRGHKSCLPLVPLTYSDEVVFLLQGNIAVKSRCTSPPRQRRALVWPWDWRSRW